MNRPNEHQLNSVESTVLLFWAPEDVCLFLSKILQSFDELLQMITSIGISLRSDSRIGREGKKICFINFNLDLGQAGSCIKHSHWHVTSAALECIKSGSLLEGADFILADLPPLVFLLVSRVDLNQFFTSSSEQLSGSSQPKSTSWRNFYYPWSWSSCSWVCFTSLTVTTALNHIDWTRGEKKIYTIITVCRR